MTKVSSPLKSASEHSRPKPAHVLAVDDAPDNLLLIEAILDDPGYHLTYAENGKEALHKVGLVRPDVILLDIAMPDMTGYEVTQRIRRNSSIPYIPILLVSASDQEGCEKGLAAGADDYIRKPFNISELEAKVKSLLQHGRSILKSGVADPWYESSSKMLMNRDHARQNHPSNQQRLKSQAG